MKQAISIVNLILGSTLFLSMHSSEALSQVIQKKVCKGELVQLELSGYSGILNIQWQQSQDADTWTNLSGATKIKHGFTAYSTDYYRAKITESTCPSYYSDTTLVVVDTLVPIALPAINIGPNYFEANWDTVLGAQGYLLDVAKDASFQVLIENSTDMGNFTTYNVSQSLLCNTPYYYRVRAYFDEFGDSISCTSNVIKVTTDTCELPAECTIKSTCNGNITDSRDNKTYKTIQIHSQCWMAENLNMGTMVAGTTPQTQDPNGNNKNTGVEKYCYGDNSANCAKYGGLYLWDEMMAYGASKSTTPGPQGICPTGWHLPTDIEWTCLEKTLGGATIAGGKLKDTTGWNAPNTGATNSSGFTALSSGYRYDTGTFNFVGYYAYFWSATESFATYAWARSLSYYYAQAIRYGNPKALYGFSVRCVKD